MSTYVIYSGTSDGRIFSSNATYATARTGSGLTASAASTNDITVGQVLSGGTYTLYEGFIQFDTSSVIGTVDTATLALYGQTDWDGLGGWTVNARLHDWGTSIDTGDWVAGASLSGKTLLATFASSGFSTSGYNTFTSDANFVSNINQSGSTRLVLSSSRMEANTAPSSITSNGDANDERLFFYTADQTGTSNDPKLTVVAYVSRTVTADAVVTDPAQTRTFTGDAIVASRLTGTATADGSIEQGTQKLKRILVGESATGNVRIFGATNGQAYRVYDSGGSVLESAVVSSGKAQFTSAVNGGTHIVGFTDNTYATRIDGQWWGGTVATGNIYDADPSKIPNAGLNVVATDGSYYYATSQFGSRGQIVETATKQYIAYRTGGAGSAYGGSSGNVVVVRVDRSTGLVDQGPTTVRSGISDGHEVFLLAQAPSGKLRIIYGGEYEHLYVRETSSADDITAWGSAVQITTIPTLPQSFAGTYMVDSNGNNHIIGGLYSGGDLYYGYASNASTTSGTWTWTHVLQGQSPWGCLMGDAVLQESGGTTYIHTTWGMYATSGGFGTVTAYRWGYYLKITGGSSPSAAKADGTSVTLPVTTNNTTGATTADQVSSLYHVGGWFKIAQVSGTPYILLDNDRNSLSGSTPGNQMVAKWNGSSWSTNTITDLPMWFTNPDTSDPADSRDISNANWGVNIQSRGSLVYVYACVGYCSLPALDTVNTGMSLKRFKSSDGFATYQTDNMVAPGYGAFTYSDLYDGGAKRSIGIWGAGFAYPKVPDDPATVLFSIVDRDYATVATSSLTIQDYTSDGVILNKPTRTYTSDGVVLAHNTRTYTSDGVIVAGTATTVSRSYTADVVVVALAVTTTRTYTTDGVVTTASPETPPVDPSLPRERRHHAYRYRRRGGEW